jgi:multisubunit Na+/H+ antiporter MnhB subunit
VQPYLPISGSVQVVPLVIAIVVGLIFCVVVSFFSLRSRNKLRSEIQHERATQPQGLIGPSERKARQWLVIGIVSALIFLVLAVVDAVSAHDHRNVPAWDSWLLAIFFWIFWGTVVTLLVRPVLIKRRRNRSP